MTFGPPPMILPAASPTRLATQEELERIPGLPAGSVIYVASSVGVASHHFLVHHADRGWAAVAWLSSAGDQRTCYMLNIEQAEEQGEGFVEDWRQASWWPDLPSLFANPPSWAHHRIPVFAAALDLLNVIDPVASTKETARLRQYDPDKATAVARYRDLKPVPLKDPRVIRVVRPA